MHVIHDLPHLVVESLFGIADGLRAELAAGSHAAAGQAATAREAKRLLQVGRAGRLGDVVQTGITAAPASGPAFGEPVLGEHPQRSRGGRRG